MSKRGDTRMGARGQGLTDRLGQSRDAQRSKLEKFAQQRAAKEAEEAQRVATEAARPRWDLSALEKAVALLPLLEAGRKERLTASPIYQRLVLGAAACVNEGKSAATLCWPAGNTSPAAVAVLLGLADSVAARPNMLGTDSSFDPPLGFRALIYPYARTAHRALRHVYVDKAFLGPLHIKHQLRSVRAGDHPALEDYHKTMARVSHLTGRARDGKSYAEILHPSLDDLMPSGPCRGTSGRNPLLGRIAAKTDLYDISRTHVADQAASAKFYLFGMRADESLKANLHAIGGELSLVLLDLDYTGRGRLGLDWVEGARLFLDQLSEMAPKTPVLALTDDPYAFDVIRFDLLGSGKGRRSKRTPCRSEVLFSRDVGIASSPNEAVGAIEEVKKWEVHGFSGGLGPLLSDLRDAARKARMLGDRETAEGFTSIAAKLRRCASLPSSISALGAFIGDDTAAADVISAYRVGTTLSDLRASHGAFQQHHPDRMKELCDAVQAAWTNAAASGPMAGLLRDVVMRFKGVSSKTAILFPKDMLAEFACSVLSEDAEFGERIAERVERGMMLFVDRAGLADLAAQPAPQRNQIKALIVVAPARSPLLTLLAEPWLPDQVIVLSDGDALASVARDTERLARYSDLQPLAERFRGFAQRAAAEAQRLSHAAIRLSLDDDAEVEELEFPLSSVIDLAGNVRAGQPTIHLEFDGGQKVRARPGTRLVVQDRNRTVPVFVETEARHIETGDRVCIIGDAFIEMARPLLNISVRAAEEIRDYHQQVTERFARIEGHSRAARLAKVVEKMAMPGVTVDRALYWVRLEEQLAAPLHEVVPCAPQDQATFHAFVKALGMSDTAANQFWLWAVIAQRRCRLRAAMAFHDAYRGILVDPHAAQSENPDRAADVRRLRSAAEGHVSMVRSKREVR
jgi:hypothetical protein